MDSSYGGSGTTASRNFSNLLNQSYNPATNGSESNKRENDGAESREDRKRRRKSRWGGDEKEKIFIPGMPTVLPTNLSKEQEEAYLVQLQIEEVSRKLRTGELGIPSNPEERCANLSLPNHNIVLSQDSGQVRSTSSPAHWFALDLVLNLLLSFSMLFRTQINYFQVARQGSSV